MSLVYDKIEYVSHFQHRLTVKQDPNNKLILLDFPLTFGSKTMGVLLKSPYKRLLVRATFSILLIPFCLSKN
jgi:hypothetical protein